MDSEQLCRKCRNPIMNCSTNMAHDKYGNWTRCPKCFDLQRQYDQQRTEWNQRVVFHVRKLDPELQDYYRYDLESGDLRNYLINMRESGRSPEEAVRAWRHKVMYLDAAANGTRKTRIHERSSPPQFQAIYEPVPQRQYRQPIEMPLRIAPPIELIAQPEMSVIYAPPVKVIVMSNDLPRTYNSDSDDSFDSGSSDSGSSDSSSSESESESESSSSAPYRRITGVVRDRHGRVEVVVKDSRGRKARARSALAYFAT